MKEEGKATLDKYPSQVGRSKPANSDYPNRKPLGGGANPPGNSGAKPKGRKGAAIGEVIGAIGGMIGVGGWLGEFGDKLAERGPYQIGLPENMYQEMVDFDRRINPHNPDRVYADGCTASGRIVKPRP